MRTSRFLLSMSGWALAALLAVHLLFLASWLRGRWSFLRTVAALGMEVYCEKGPFVMLTSKDFPRVQSLALVQRGDPSLNVMVQDLGEEKNNKRRSVMVGLPPHFSLSVEYAYSTDSSPRVQQVMLTRSDGKRSEAFFDHGGRGVFDTHVVEDTAHKKGGLYVRYEGNWRKTLGGDEDPEQDTFHKRLVDGTRVSFDEQKGEWRATGSENTPSRNRMTNKGQ